MKTLKIIILFTFIFLSFLTKGQDFWEEVVISDSITPAYLNFNTESHIYFPSSGGLYKSINNGNNWSLLLKYNSGLQVIVKDCEIFVGIDVFGNLFHSSDEGLSWDTLNSSITGTFLRIYNDSILFCLG